MGKELVWRKELKKRGTNPDWGELQLFAIMKELRKDKPCLSYIGEKMEKFQRFVDDLTFTVSKGAV